MSKIETGPDSIASTPLEQADPFWPDYSIRKSKRAKYLRINVCPVKGIEIVVPQRTSLKQARHFFEQHHEWARQQMNQHKARPSPRLPTTIHLEAIDKKWQVKYQLNNHQQYRVHDKHPVLLVNGPSDNFAPCRKSLQRWLRRSARETLPEILQQVSSDTGLTCKKVVVRSQKTRWGSYSSSGTINLNDRLMLLPRDTVEYVLLHELCHTRHMNHSEHFWNLVAQHNPDYRHHETILKDSTIRLPGWSY